MSTDPRMVALANVMREQLRANPLPRLRPKCGHSLVTKRGRCADCGRRVDQMAKGGPA